MSALSKVNPSRLADGKAALQFVLKEKNIDDVKPILGGYSSSHLYKVTSAENIFVLRVMGLDQPVDDRRHQITCFQIASRLGLAPRVLYANEESGIVVMEYILHQKSIGSEWLFNLAKSLRRLHDSSQSFPQKLGPSHWLFEIMSTLRKEKVPNYLNTWFSRVEEIVQHLEAHKEYRSCHNDLNSGNILWDGKKVILIDFEAASLEDPYFDLATVINHFIFELDLENQFLQTYFGVEVQREQRIKLSLMKQVSYCYYAAHFLSFARQQNIEYFKEKDLEKLPTMKDIRRGLIDGSYRLETAEHWMAYGSSFIKAATIEAEKNVSF